MGIKYSIVIPCYLVPYNSNELTGFTKNCIQSIRKYSSDYELILIDNGSTVDSDYLMEEANVYVRNKTNLGFAPAVNQGLKLATGEYIIVSNNDIEFINDWIADATSAFNETTGVLSSHLHDHDPEHKVGSIIVDWGGMFGALWMTKRSVIDKVGFLDEGYVMGMWEDRDYWKRIEKAGYKFMKAGWCKHIGNATWGKIPNQHEIFNANQKRFEEKWL